MKSLVLFVLSGSLLFSSLSLAETSKCRPGEISEAKNWKIWQDLLGENRDPRLKVIKRCILEPDHQSSHYDAYVLEVFIGRIKSEKIFNRVKDYFGGQSKVRFNPEKDYDLIDFLPPAMQAMVNQVFLPEHYSHLSEKLWKLKETADEGSDALMYFFKNGLGSSSNCWNTTIENIRLLFGGDKTGLGDYHLYWPGRWEISDYINDSTQDDTTPNPISQVIPQEQIRFGDVLAVYQSNHGFKTLQHTSIVLTKELVFEKVDSGARYPYRIALRDDSPKKIKEFFADDTREDSFVGVEYRRVNPQVNFPGPSRFDFEDPEVFPANIYSQLPQEVKDLFITFGCETGMGGGCDPMLTAVAKVKVTVDPESGRGQLTPIVQSKRYFGGTEVLQRFKPVTYYR